MKKPLYVILWLTALAVTPAFSQGTAMPQLQTNAATLTKFDLDFPGGTPNELVAAIQKSMGRPLNAIVPTEYASVKLPSLKMRGVDVAQLFQALEQANRTNHGIFGFRTISAVSDDSVWFFYFTGQPRTSNFYLLTPYLDSGLKVDDITTAIQTGWKMAGISPTPELSFHKETKLLIGVGDLNQLQTIDQVLHALSAPTPATKAKPDPEKTKP